MEKHYFDCQCECGEHFVRFVLDPTTGDVWTEVYLRPQPWPTRVWNAVAYVFGQRSAFGDFDCVFLKPEDRDRLRALLTRAAQASPERQPAPLLGPTE